MLSTVNLYAHWYYGAGFMRRKFLVIHNSSAGRTGDFLLRNVVEQLSRHRAELVVNIAASIAEDRDMAAAAVRRGEVDAVIAAGGDSTIRGVALGLKDSTMPLGIIPAGTGNVLAHEIGLDGDGANLAHVLMHAKARCVNMGLANGEAFLLMAGAGFDAEVVKNLDHGLKQRIGKAAYIWPVLKALAAGPDRFSVEFSQDSENLFAEKHPEGALSFSSYSAAFVVVTRARFYAGRFIIAPDADLSSEELQVVMFMNQGRWGLMRALLGLAMGQNGRLKKTARDREGALRGHIMKTPGVMIRPARSVRITSRQPFAMQIDGDYVEHVGEGDRTIAQQDPVASCPTSAGREPCLEIGADGGQIKLIMPERK